MAFSTRPPATNERFFNSSPERKTGDLDEIAWNDKPSPSSSDTGAAAEAGGAGRSEDFGNAP
ncbi:MAG TPA: hypothetical protein VF457_01300 [Burkholderiaceae bacterium]